MIAIISDNNIDINEILEKSISQGDIRERQAIEMKLLKMFGKLLLLCLQFIDISVCFVH